MGSDLIFPRPWNTDGCWAMMSAMDGVVELFSSSKSDVRAVSAPMELIVLNVTIPSDSARL